jgi:flagellar motor switch protein FliM
MSPLVDHLGKAKIQQLLAAMGSIPAPEQAVGNAMPYDWRDPRYLNADQLNRLAAVMSQAAARFGVILTRFFRNEFDVSPTGITQHFAGDLLRFVDPANSYSATFSPEKGSSCGFLAITSQMTTTWASRLLGDTEIAGDANRSMSSLEQSLLSDLVAAVLDAFLASLRPHETLRSDGPLSKGQPNIPFERTEEICKIVFRVKEAGKEESSDIAFVLSCSRLAALVGKPVAAAPRTAPQELSQTLMEHLQQMPVTIQARLATAKIGFQELLDLGPGDILLLDKPIQEMVELTVENHTAFRGRPAQSDGRYAILIREGPPKQEETRTGAQPQAGRGQETPAPKIRTEPRKG